MPRHSSSSGQCKWTCGNSVRSVACHSSDCQYPRDATGPCSAHQRERETRSVAGYNNLVHRRGRGSSSLEIQ